MKIRVESHYLFVKGVKHLQGSILDYELSGRQKADLVLNGQATYYTPKPEETAKPEDK